MKIFVAAFLSFLIAFSSMTAYAAEPSTEIELPEFDSVTGDTSGMHKEIKPVRGTGTTLENCAPGKLKFYSIKGKTYQNTTSGHQLFDATQLKYWTSSSFKVSDNGYTIEVSGKSVYANSGCELDYSLFAGKKVYLKADSVESVQDVKTGVSIGVTSSSGTIYYDIFVKGNTVRSVDIPDDVTKMTLHVYANNSSTAISEDNIATVKGLMLSFSDVDWEPYTGGATPNPLHPQKYESVMFDKIKVSNKNGEQNEVDFITSVFLLNGIGNVRDEITDSKMIQRIGEIVVDGTETIVRNDTWNYYVIEKSVSDFSKILMSDYGKATSESLANQSNTGKVSMTSTHIYVGCYGLNISTVDDFKALLNNNPMSVLYELKEPIETELSQADIFNFGWLDTYEGTNYISFVGSPLVPDIEVEYSVYFEKIYDSTLLSFVSFMKMIFNFVDTEFTIWGFTFSYWQIIVLSCLAGIVGYFIYEAFGG